MYVWLYIVTEALCFLPCSPKCQINSQTDIFILTLIHAFVRASSAVILVVGSGFNSCRMRSLASEVTVSHSGEGN